MEERAVESFREKLAVIMAGKPSCRRRYPEEMRQEALGYLARREQAGETLACVAGRLGLSAYTLHGWRAERQRRLLPIRVKPAPELPREQRGGVLITPTGYRVEGLRVEELAGLLERLR